LFSICHFNTFNNWAVAKLGSTRISYGFMCYGANGNILAFFKPMVKKL
jgi:hypothetical protein